MQSFLALRMTGQWKYFGGWHCPFGKRRAVGVAPPRWMTVRDTPSGSQIFLPGPDIHIQVTRTHSRERSRALAAGCYLPAWRNEGLSMVAVDRLEGAATVRPETREVLVNKTTTSPRRSAVPQNLFPRDKKSLLWANAGGYWVARCLAEEHPAPIQNIRSKRTRSRHADFPESSCGIPKGDFRKRIGGMAPAFFSQKAAPAKK